MFCYKVTFMNSQHTPSNSKGYFVVTTPVLDAWLKDWLWNIYCIDHSKSECKYKMIF